jgi:hypothetical protein
MSNIEALEEIADQARRGISPRGRQDWALSPAIERAGGSGRCSCRRVEDDGMKTPLHLGLGDEAELLDQSADDRRQFQDARIFRRTRGQIVKSIQAIEDCSCCEPPLFLTDRKRQ